MSDFEHILSPFKIGDLTIKNRLVMPPMDTRFPTEDCQVSQQGIDYYAARAKGGFGLLIHEYMFVSEWGRPHTHSQGICDDKYIPGLQKLTAAVHEAAPDCKFFAQLFHCASQNHPTPEETNHPYTLGPSPIQNVVSMVVPHEMTTEEVYQSVEDFGDAALRAKKAGFDGVQIHAAHGYLVSLFMMAIYNKRTDEFGGDFLGRMRFPKLIVENIRKKCGPDFPITMRIGSEPVPNGKGVEELVAEAIYLEKCGVQGFNVSTYGWRNIIAPSQKEIGYNIPYAAQIKAAVNVPVVAGGRMHDPYIVDQAIATGKVDGIFLGRQSLADPEYPNKLKEGKYDEIIQCTGCIQRCQLHLFDHSQHISCMLNPFTGREGTWKVVPAETAKNIAVVGAGPAGLNAAFNAARRGHKVTLFEKTSHPGGMLRTGTIAPFKHELVHTIKYPLAMCKKYGVDIRYNTEATEEMLLDGNFDSVILCTGGVPVKPPIPGIDGPNIYMAEDVLLGQIPAMIADPNLPLPGGNILIVGAGLVGVETADYLAEQNMGMNRITIVEMTDQIAPQEHFTTKSYLMERLAGYGVQFALNTKITQFTETGVIAEQNGETVTMEGYNTIILAMGTKSYNPLEEKLAGKIELYKAGDVIQARNAVPAIEEATKIGLEI